MSDPAGKIATMTGETRVRKDGRPLVTEHPVTAQDFVDYYDGPIPPGGFGCKLDFEEEDESWMDHPA